MNRLVANTSYELGERIIIEKSESVRGHARVSHVYGVIIAIKVNFAKEKGQVVSTHTYDVLDTIGVVHSKVDPDAVSSIEVFIIKQESLMTKKAQECSIYIQPEKEYEDLPNE